VSLIICTPQQRFSGDQIEKNEMGGACSMYGAVKRRGAYWVLVGKTKGRRPFG
jgi:hypothetical protein